MSTRHVIRITGTLAAIACLSFLVGAWNGIYNLMSLAESAETIGGREFVAGKASRALLYISGACVSFLWLCATVYLSRRNSQRPTSSSPAVN